MRPSRTTSSRSRTTRATITFDTARLRVRSLSCAPTDYFGNSSLAFGELALNLDGYLINPSYKQSVPPGTSWYGYIPQHRVLIKTDEGRWPAMSYDANGISYKVRFTMLGAGALHHGDAADPRPARLRSRTSPAHRSRPSRVVGRAGSWPWG